MHAWGQFIPISWLSVFHFCICHWILGGKRSGSDWLSILYTIHHPTQRLGHKRSLLWIHAKWRWTTSSWSHGWTGGGIFSSFGKTHRLQSYFPEFCALCHYGSLQGERLLLYPQMHHHDSLPSLGYWRIFSKANLFYVANLLSGQREFSVNFRAGNLSMTKDASKCTVHET